MRSISKNSPRRPRRRGRKMAADSGSLTVHMPEPPSDGGARGHDKKTVLTLPRGTRCAGRDCVGATCEIPAEALQEKGGYALVRTADFSKLPPEARSIAITPASEDWWNSKVLRVTPPVLRKALADAADARFRMFRAAVAADNSAAILKKRTEARRRRPPATAPIPDSGTDAKNGGKRTMARKPNLRKAGGENPDGRRTLGTIEKTHRKAAEILGGAKK